MPACHAKWSCFSRNRTLGERVDSLLPLDSRESCSATAIASDAGPNPAHTRSWTSSSPYRCKFELLVSTRSGISLLEKVGDPYDDTSVDGTACGDMVDDKRRMMVVQEG